MKTATFPHSARFRMWKHAIAAVTVATLAPWQAVALTPPGEAAASQASATAATNPHFAYLESLAARGEAVQDRATAVRNLVERRAALARQYTQATLANRARLAAELDQVEQDLARAENALEDSLAASTPVGGPNYVAPFVDDIEAIRASATRRRRPIYLPVPRPAPLPSLPAPDHERALLDYLAARSVGSDFSLKMVEDAARLLRERRELTYRHLHAAAAQQGVLEIAIRAVSQRLRDVTAACIEAAETGR